MADRYFTPDLDPLASSYLLEGPEAHHFRTVCRGKVGQTVHLFDGRGQVAIATVTSVERRSASLDIVSRTVDEPPTAGLVLGTCIPKGDRGTFLVEKLTELGVARLIPLQTARSVTEPKEGKLARFELTMIEACKQSRRNFLMEIDGQTPWSELVIQERRTRWLLDPAGDVPNGGGAELPKIVAIGPEGGWTDEELELAASHGWKLIRLPGNILRVETAAIAVAAYWRIVAAVATNP
jgi:16S rRNA (uracil1498-N3)-methyltransferase